MMRISTPLGSLLHHPDYGTRVHDYLGVKNLVENQQKIRVEIERTLRGDNRVEDIVVSNFVVDYESVYVILEIKPIGLDQIIEMGIALNSEGVVEWA
jgi:hypothetical protein